MIAGARLLDWLLERLCLFYLRISQVLLILLVVGILAEVVLRYVFGSSWSGTAELARLAITWLVFLMAVVLYRSRKHIMVTALSDVLPSALQRIAEIIINVSVILLSIYILVQLHDVWEFLGLRTAVLRIPDTAFKAAPAFCFVPIGLQSVVNLVRPRNEIVLPGDL